MFPTAKYILVCVVFAGDFNSGMTTGKRMKPGYFASSHIRVLALADIFFMLLLVLTVKVKLLAPHFWDSA